MIEPLAGRRAIDDAHDLRVDLARQNLTLTEYKRVGALLEYAPEFPRTASQKIKREPLARAIGVTKYALKHV